MKNLANCKPSEFLKQTNRIKHSAEKWLKVTDVLNIRQNLPTIPEGATREEIARLNKEQAMKNLSIMLDAIMDKHPDETLELLALVCFVEPENVDDHPVSEYLDTINELIHSEAVLGFFTSLAQLGRRNG